MILVSRSYKRTPVSKEGYGSKKLKFWKRLSNKKIRRTKDVPNNKEFKKIFESWMIHDFSFYYDESQLDTNCDDYESLKEHWRKYYFRK